MDAVVVYSRFEHDALNVFRVGFDPGKYNVEFRSEQERPDTFLGRIDPSSVTAMIVRSEVIGENLIDKFPNLRVIVRAGAGYEKIAHGYAGDKKIVVENTPGANASAVCELLFGDIIGLYRRLARADRSVKAGHWAKNLLQGEQIYGKRFGIVGVGHVGQRVARVANAFDAEVLGYDPYIDPVIAERYGVTLVDTLEELFESDIVTLHCPENDETTGMVGYEQLRRIPAKGLFVNLARAPIVVLDDLVRVMEERPELLFAGDVYHEPERPGEKVMAQFGKRVILTPHIGGKTVLAEVEAARMAVDQTIQLLEYDNPINAVNVVGLPGDLAKYGVLAQRLGAFARHWVGVERPHVVDLFCYGDLADHREALVLNALRGVVERPEVPLDQLRVYAERHGIAVKVKGDKSFDRSQGLELRYEARNGATEETRLRGIVSQEEDVELRVVDNVQGLSAHLDGNLVGFSYPENRGVLAQISNAFSEGGFNIGESQLKRSKDEKTAIALLHLSNGEFDPREVMRITRSLETRIQAHRAAFVPLGNATNLVQHV